MNFTLNTILEFRNKPKRDRRYGSQTPYTPQEQDNALAVLHDVLNHGGTVEDAANLMDIDPKVLARWFQTAIAAEAIPTHLALV